MEIEREKKKSEREKQNGNREVEKKRQNNLYQ